MKKLLLPLLLLSTVSSTYLSAEQNASQQSNKTINLYIYPGCPYCKKVTQFLQKNDWLDNVTIINANLPQHYAKLQELSNSTQCPFLNDNVHNVNMAESKDIIKHFEKIFKQ